MNIKTISLNIFVLSMCCGGFILPCLFRSTLLYTYICPLYLSIPVYEKLGILNTQNSCMIKTLGNRFVEECSICNNNFDVPSTISVWMWMWMSTRRRRFTIRKKPFTWKVALKTYDKFININHHVFVICWKIGSFLL